MGVGSVYTSAPVVPLDRYYIAVTHCPHHHALESVKERLPSTGCDNRDGQLFRTPTSIWAM